MLDLWGGTVTVARTSRLAYMELQANGKESTQKGKVLKEVLRHSDGLTRRQLAELTGLELGAVCGRVNALVRDGLLDDSEVVKCEVTGQEVARIKPVGPVVAFAC